MSFDQFEVQRARFAIENVDSAESNFASDLTSDIATNFDDLRHEPFRLMRADMTTPDTTVVQLPFQRYNDIIGPSRASAKITSFWVGTNEALPDGTTPTQITQTKILDAIFGNSGGDQGSTVAASPSPTTTSCTVATGEGSRFTKGQTVAIGTTAASAVPVQLTNVSTDALTWWPALASAPSTSDNVYNSQFVYPDASSKQTIQVLAEFANQRGNVWLGLGGWPTGFTFDWSRGALAKWSLDLSFAKYLHDDEFTTTIGGSAISAASYDGTGPGYADEGGLILTPASGSTRTLVSCSALTVNFGGAAARYEIGMHSGTEGLASPERSTREPITIEVTVLKPDPYEDYHDAFLAETDYSLMFWINGAGAGSGRCFAAPTCQIALPPEPTEAFGMEGQKLTLLVKNNGRTDTPTTALHYAPFVLGHY